MKVAYLTEWSPFAETGVLRKMIGQVAAWREHGAEASLFCLATRQGHEPPLAFREFGDVVGHIHQVAVERYPFARLGYVNKIVSVRAMRAALRAFRPDITYYRQNGPWYPGIGALLSVAPTVMEVNTDEDVEQRLWSRASYAIHRATRNRIYGQASGFVAVTGELADKFRTFGRPVGVVANSFMTDEGPLLEPTRNAEPAFVFVGSRLTGGLSWHGVDKIFALAEAMPASIFNIVGLAQSDFPRAVARQNVVFHGPKAGKQLLDLYRISDIGIGTLALHRKSMQEACPLKVREYLLHRIPAIIGYREAEESLNKVDYILNIGNSTDNVQSNIERIRSFSWAWANRRIECPLDFLSRRHKEAQRLMFLKSVVAGG